jgi:sarcosine oxidase subunit alpha
VKRLASLPGERIDRSRPLKFSFDGKPAEGFAGDTIASALIASGRQILSRSFKYHRPRGELCGCGQCANSLVTVDGLTGVRACGEPLVEGMKVIHQNAWPSLDFDAMRVTDRVGGPFTQVGFYYKTFIRPRRMWPVYERVLRSAAGLGKLPKRQDERIARTEYRRRHCDLLVIGGGVAGATAAVRAAELGGDVVLCDDGVEIGGGLLAEGETARARELAARLAGSGVEVLTRASAFGFFDGLVPVWQGETLHQVRAARHIVATGTVEQPLVFADNDLPGVMLAGGAQRLAALYAVGSERAVIATVGDSGMVAALALQAAGTEVAAVADLRSDLGDNPLVGRLEDAGIAVRAGSTVVRAVGRNGVKAAAVASVDAQGVAVAKGRTEIDCDLLAISGGEVPASSLLLQAGARAVYDAPTGRFLPGEMPAGVAAAGSVVGAETRAAAARSGLVAGLEAALALGLGTDADRVELKHAEEKVAGLRSAPVATPPAVIRDRSGSGKSFVDLDEDVTVKDVKHAVEEGFDSIELSKRYTTATMGPSQGRFSQLAAVRVLAEATETQVEQVGLTTARPPWTTIPLSVLAGRPFEAAKRSAIHHRHRELGGTIKWAGDWRRAYDYGDPEGEALAVQRSVGLIDVSTLGKLVVRGPDAAELLDRLYPNTISSLKPGRIRYGVMLTDAGRIMDDGTVCRIDDETFYVSTTSSGAAAVEQWMTWWLAAWDLDAYVTDVTQGMVAVNLAGPEVRAVLGGLTDLDCSNEAFSYLDAKHATVAGVPCLLLRIGFVGEVGYEIHCAAPHGEALWDALAKAGSERGLKPFGLEAQRILRLQKQHILVGQDTDSESQPAPAGMGWIVKMDKPQQFLGRWALEHVQGSEPNGRLVGFTVPGGHLPLEGAAVLDRVGGVPAGQVTSSRRSPLLGEVIGMAWVPADQADDGARIAISDRGKTVEAVVTTKPFYDPEGEVLRS